MGASVDRTMNLSSEKSDEPKPLVSVMEGKGFYNKYAAIPAAGSAIAPCRESV
jgi:hypothetical protein